MTSPHHAASSSANRSDTGALPSGGRHRVLGTREWGRGGGMEGRRRPSNLLCKGQIVSSSVGHIVFVKTNQQCHFGMNEAIDTM